MLKLFTTYCLVFFASLAFAQSTDTFKITGVVIAANSGEPIPNGVIMVTRTKGNQSDSSGRFGLYNLKAGQHKLSFSAFGYNNKDTIVTITNTDVNNLRWTIYTDCWMYNREKALKDIQDNRPLLLIQSGDAPVVYTSDKDFERRYTISYKDFGCVAEDMQECLIAYNRGIFEYLDKAYGKSWRRKIRTDVIGLKKK